MFGDVHLFVDILPKVLAACLIAAFVAVLMPRETVLRWVGAESGLVGILIATLAGTVCPGGPITIFFGPFHCSQALNAPGRCRP